MLRRILLLARRLRLRAHSQPFRLNTTGASGTSAPQQRKPEHNHSEVQKPEDIGTRTLPRCDSDFWLLTSPILLKRVSEASGELERILPETGRRVVQESI